MLVSLGMQRSNPPQLRFHMSAANMVVVDSTSDPAAVEDRSLDMEMGGIVVDSLLGSIVVERRVGVA